MLSFAALATDTRYALRSVRKNLRPFLLSTLIVALGTGACTAVYSLLNPLMIRQLPFAEAERLVWVANEGEAGNMSGVTSRTSNLRDFRAMNHSFDGLTGYFAFFDYRTYNFTDGGEPERLVGVDVASDFLDVLGVPLAAGRGFVEEEGAWGGPPVVILSHGLWTRSFAADPEVVGTSIILNGQPREVVGVLPASFDFAAIFAPHTHVDFLRPFAISDETDRWGNTVSMIGRLKPGATVASAQADLDGVVDRLAEADPGRWGLGAAVSGLRDQVAGPFRSAAWLLAAGAGSVMLIVCVNLSNLLLSQGSERQREMAVRSALGASRGRLVRQLLLESLFLSLAGSALGLVMAAAAVRYVVGSSAITVPLLSTASLDLGSFVFAAALSIAVAALIGLVPALQVTRREAAVVRGEGRSQTASRGSRRLRSALVVAEVSLACVLLVFGGLLLRSFQNVLGVELGFQPTQVVSWSINTSRGFDSQELRLAYYRQLVDEVSAAPGVDEVGLTDAIPLGRNRTWGLRAPGYDYDGHESLDTYVHVVDAGYLSTMKIQRLRGRLLSPDDTSDRPAVVVLNETAARAVFHGEEALGRTVMNGDREMQVVGVVADVRHRSLEEGFGAEMYLPMMQIGDFASLDLVVRSALSPSTLAPGVTAALHSQDPSLPLRSYRSLDAVVEKSVSPRRFVLQLLAAFAATALLLAILGIYGVQSFAVSAQVKEIGIRMALGETGRGVLWRILAGSLVLAGAGLALGIAASLVASRWAASMLFGVQPTDPATFVVMAALLMLVSALAGLLPAWRAARTPVASVLRSS